MQFAARLDRIVSRQLQVLAVPGLLLLGGIPSVAPAMGGQEGTFEFAIDAPWRLEPVVAPNGSTSYGAIPFVITLTDENITQTDAYDKPIGNFCDLTLNHGSTTQRFGFRDLSEVEMTGNATTTTIEKGSWTQSGSPPPHVVCNPINNACQALQSPHGTSEWYAVAWYKPATLTPIIPGTNTGFTATLRFTKKPSISCEAANSNDYLVMTNYLSVHYGEAPLPRFSDRNYAYGDLHYHSQGTDNEGESGYGYRGTVRAMGAMGLDFALAVEHASDSKQYVDLDYNLNPELLSGNIVWGWSPVLRDMNAARFGFLHDELWTSADSANNHATIDGGGQRPPGVLARNTAPQILLGGEVDTIPELGHLDNTDHFSFGNGETYKIESLCGGWTWLPGLGGGHCSPSRLIEFTDQSTIALIRDEQGFNDFDFARAHMVYFPGNGASREMFVSSKTGQYGGASRRLRKGADPILPELEGGKGYTFLAHPIPKGGCDGNRPGMEGDNGPDVVPYTAAMLDQGFYSQAVLGLEFWNEDGRMENKPSAGALEIGFHTPGDEGGHGLRNDVPKGFNTGRFELSPWPTGADAKYNRTCAGIEWMLHHGLKTWDTMMMKGLWPTDTAQVRWLASGEPRRLFMAGGSDAHGDLNYHRAGYARGLTSIDDMAIGKPRNLVYAGSPSRVVGGAGAELIQAFSHTQVLDGLRSGNFAVTDGPALRIAIDKNGNGHIDSEDLQMGSIVEMYGDTSLPLLVEWNSSLEWGPVQQIELVIGAVNSTELVNNKPDFNFYSAIFAPVGNGPRTAGTPKSDVRSLRSVGNGRTITLRTDGYADDPLGGVMRFNPPWSLTGTRKIDIPLAKLAVGAGYGGKSVVPDRLYIRAYARSRPVQGTTGKCTPDFRNGNCQYFYAFTNPIWAITPARQGGSCPKTSPHSVDTDLDGMPNGCDPCPHTKKSVCGFAAPPGGPAAPPSVSGQPNHATG